MNRKTWLAVGLSMLVGTGIATTLPASVLVHRDVTSPRASVQLVRWGEQGGEQGEVESPRWGDQGGEQGEVESPRWGDQGSEQGEVESPRWGDQGSEQGEVELPRAGSGYQGGDRTDTGAPRV